MQRNIQNFVFKYFSVNSRTNCRRFFSYVKTKRCGIIAVAPFHKNETNVISSAERYFVLNNQFRSLFTKGDSRKHKLTLLLSTEMPQINIDIDGMKQCRVCMHGSRA